MATIAELNKKKGDLVHQMRDTVELAAKENRALTAEDDARIDKIKQDIVEVNKQVEVLEEVQRHEAVLKTAQADGSGLNGNMGSVGGDSGQPHRSGDLTLRQKKDIAFTAWVKSSFDDVELTDQELQCCKELGINLHSGKYNLQLHHKQRTVKEIQQVLEAGTASEGGYTVSDTYSTQLELALATYTNMLQYGQVMITPTGNPYHWPTMNDTSNEGVIVAEEADVETLLDPSFSEMVLGAYKFSSKMTKMTSELIQDSMYNLPEIIGAQHGERIGRHMNRKFTVGAGSGSGEPMGIVTATSAGLVAASETTITWNEVLTLITKLGEAYRPGARFMMHEAIELALQLMKDSNGQYIWSPDVNNAGRGVIRGYPVVLNSYMASTLVAETKAMIFGQLSYYKIRMVQGVRARRLSELYAKYDMEGFITFIRADGNLLNAGAAPITALETAAAA